ncbi:Mannan-binding lectin serine protease 1 [Zancudomyces culisetae]|uniref:Mannan-binding lectin serine protease 1 n=1 Tax=Zancudomyces culisetae TaxID=1213189 RepID=A0A1R1PCZ4_ZANCU|nr:Mannan-binding lectin serine protease 1 [Zancudomyces culisetae]|eukprot:OMH78840.1 Mannan-binding lectin serine protease 1 [Zancudomyces culisetae]
MDHISIYIFGGASSYDSIALTRARAVHYHPKYSYQSLENDIAIVELNSPVSKDIATPVAIYSGDVMDDMNLVAAGWDFTSSEPLRRSYYELTRVTRTPSSSNVCKKLHPSWSNNNKGIVCTHVNDTKDLLYSSNGGPLTYMNNGVNLLVGIGDAVVGNFNGEYGSEGIKARYHTHVYSYIDWIVKTTGLEKSYLLNTTARPSPNYSTVTNIETYGNNESMISASTILQNTGFILVVFLSLVFSLLF